MTCVPLCVLEELMGAGLEGPALLAACRRVAVAMASSNETEPDRSVRIGPISPANPVNAAKPDRVDPACGKGSSLPRAGGLGWSQTEPVPRPGDVGQRSDKAVAREAIALVPGLSVHAMRLFLLLVDHVNARTGRCDPGHAGLARRMGVSDRTVRRASAELVARGVMSIGLHAGGGHRNAYRPDWIALRAAVENGGWAAGATGGENAANAANRTGQTGNADRSVLQNPELNPESLTAEQVEGRPPPVSRRRAGKPPDRRQGTLLMPIPGSRGASPPASRREAQLASSRPPPGGARYGPSKAAAADGEAQKRIHADLLGSGKATVEAAYQLDPAVWERAVTLERQRRGGGSVHLLTVLAGRQLANPRTGTA